MNTLTLPEFLENIGSRSVVDFRGLNEQQIARYLTKMHHDNFWPLPGNFSNLCWQLEHAAHHCAYCGNLLEPDEGTYSRVYNGLICDTCDILEG